MKNLILFLVFTLPISLTLDFEKKSIKDRSNKYIDYQSFAKLTKDIEAYRLTRRLDLKTFLEMQKEENVILLDTRSKEAFDQKHLKGAVHLNFSDFTEEKLAEIIPNKNTTILIYCNNNFVHDPLVFARKMPPLALNIPTFINLYGYGYKDIYELRPTVSVNHKLLEFEGSRKDRINQFKMQQQSKH